MEENFLIFSISRFISSYFHGFWLPEFISADYLLKNFFIEGWYFLAHLWALTTDFAQVGCVVSSETTMTLTAVNLGTQSEPHDGKNFCLPQSNTSQNGTVLLLFCPNFVFVWQYLGYGDSSDKTVFCSEKSILSTLPS